VDEQPEGSADDGVRVSGLFGGGMVGGGVIGVGERPDVCNSGNGIGSALGKELEGVEV